MTMKLYDTKTLEIYKLEILWLFKLLLTSFKTTKSIQHNTNKEIRKGNLEIRDHEVRRTTSLFTIWTLGKKVNQSYSNTQACNHRSRIAKRMVMNPKTHPHNLMARLSIAFENPNACHIMDLSKMTKVALFNLNY